MPKHFQSLRQVFNLLDSMANLPPDDDDGLEVDLLTNPGQAKVKAKPRVKKTKTTQGPTTPPLVLPPDDDGVASFAFSEGNSGVPKTKPARGRGRGGARGAGKSKPKPGVSKDVKSSNPKSLKPTDDMNSGLLWTDHRLKDAAQQFASVVEMPYSDLASMYFGEPPIRPSNHERCDLWEIYSVPRLGPCIRELGGQCRRSYDILHFWNLANTDYKRLLIQDICLLLPKALMLSPPCRFVCLLMASNWSRMKNVSEKMMNLEEALGHIDLCMWLAQFQILHDAIFAFEHPQGSLAWDRDSAP